MNEISLLQQYGLIGALVAVVLAWNIAMQRRINVLEARMGELNSIIVHYNPQVSAEATELWRNRTL